MSNPRLPNSNVEASALTEGTLALNIPERRTRPDPPLVTNVSNKETAVGANIELTAIESGSEYSPDSQKEQSLPEVLENAPSDETSQADKDPMEGGEVGYKCMHWFHAGMLIIAETISLGILSLPSCVAAVGLVPGVILIVVMGMLAMYTGYVIGQCKQKHVKIVSMADAGGHLFGPIGRVVFAVSSTLMFICYMAAHILTFSICFNVLTGHATCSLVFGVVGFIVSFLCSMPRTLKKVSYQSIASFASIGVSVLITMFALGLSKKGGEGVEAIVHYADKYKVIIGIMDIVMAYAGNVAFFGFISEMAKPADFSKALVFLYTTTTSIYVLAAVVIYYYGGKLVPSPALGATSPLVRKIAYGVAIPTIIVAGVINAHIAAKYIYVTLCGRGDPPLFQRRTTWAWGSWLLIVAAIWAVAWAVASAIPNFNSLLALISALFGTWFTFGIPGMLWIQMNMDCVRKPSLMFKGGRKGACKFGLLCVNVFLICFAAALCISGMWASVHEIASERSGKPFSCEDNSLM